MDGRDDIKLNLRELRYLSVDSIKLVRDEEHYETVVQILVSWNTINRFAN